MMKPLVRNHKCIVSVLLTSLIILSLQCTIHEQEANAQTLNAGEPRTVRLIYYLPNGRSYSAEVVEEIKTGILEVQSFFADQMEAHGHGRKTFQIETDDQGDPIVHRVDENDENRFDFSANNFLIVRDDGQRSGHGVTFRSGKNRSGKNGARAIINGGWDWFAAGHELGHAFGLDHDFRDDTYLMSYGRANQTSAQLSACAAEFLTVNPYFNSTIPLKDGTPPTIEFLSPAEYAPGTQSVTIRARVKDSDGLHQVLLQPKGVTLYSSIELKACRGLTGETDITVQFDYDGVIPSSPAGSTNLSRPPKHQITVKAVDKAGNSHSEWLVLRERSEKHIATLEGHEKGFQSSPTYFIPYGVNSVAFSPNGRTLASGADDGTVKLWNVNTRTNIATFRHGGQGSSINSVAFSPDGRTLASGGGVHYYNHTIELWNIASQTNIATFTDHPDYIRSLAFSPDGTILATGGNKTIKLWNVATRAKITTLEGHTSGVNSVAFSPDGTMLASGSTDNTVKLWDMTTLTNIATLVDDNRVTSVAFSPDGTTLALGLNSKQVSLWDMVKREKIATIGSSAGGETPVAFSPDGTILATVAQSAYENLLDSGTTVIALWDVEKRTNIATFRGHSSSVESVAFSPDGTMLASTSKDATIRLWDTSEWAGTPVVNRPPTGAVTISGTVAMGETLTADVSTLMDPDGPSTLALSYQWLADASPIVEATSKTYILTANEIGKKIRVRVSYIDGLGAPVTVTSAEVFTNIAPTFIDGASTARTVAENTAANVNIGTAIAATDANNDTLTYSLSGTDAASFSIVSTSGQLQTKAALDYETKNAYSVTVSVSDSNGGSDSITVTINVTDVIEGTIDPPLSQRTSQVRDAIVAAVPGVNNAADVTLAHLAAITSLILDTNGALYLRSGDFSGLSSLITLEFRNNGVLTLPKGVFTDLSALETLRLANNGVLTLSEGVFTDLSALETLRLTNNGVLTLPEGIFTGLSSLTTLEMRAKTLTVSLEKVADGQFKAIAPTGAPFDMVLPITVSHGSISSGATTVTIPKGSAESGTLTVTRTTGTTAAVTVDVGTLPSLPQNHQGYTLVKSADLPLEVITGTNIAPVFTDGTTTTRTVAENTTANTNIGAAIAATDADISDTLTYSLSGPDAAAFSIVSTTGQLQTKAALDYETKTSYTVTVTVSDGNSGTDSITVTINVTDVTEATIDPPLSQRTPQVRDAIVAAVSGVNNANDVTLAHLAAITKLELSWNVSREKIISLKAGDFSGLTSLEVLWLSHNSLTNLPEGIFDELSSLEVIDLLYNNINSIPSNMFKGLTSLKRLDLQGNRLTSLSTEWFDDLSSLETLSFKGNSLTELPTNVFDKLTSLKSLDLSSNSLTSLPTDIFDELSTLTHLHLRNTSLTSLPTDIFDELSSLIWLDIGYNSLTSIPDGIFDGLSALITLVLSGNTIDPMSLPVSLEKVADGQFKAVSPTGAPFDMVLPLTVTNGSISGGASSITISKGSTESGSLTVTRTSGTIADVTVNIGTLPGIPTSHQGYALVKSTTDLPLTVIPAVPNNDPVFTDGTTVTRPVAENTAANVNIGTPITATDADSGDTLTYILSGTDAASFGIDSTTGQLKTKAALDYETKTSYSVTITVSDGNGGSDSITVTINVTDVNENTAPVFTDGTAVTRTVAENTASGQNIGTAIAATDADTGDTLTYTLEGTDAASFSIVSTTGQLQTKAALDYETKTSYSVTVSVSDGNGGSDSITVTINVTDVNENTAPVFTDGTSTTRSIAENTAANTNIGTPIAATDADSGDTLTYTLGGTDAASFSIVSTTGQLQTKAALDYETKTSYSVTISVSDGNGGSDSITVAINVTDVNETPANTAPVFSEGDSITLTITLPPKGNTEGDYDVGDPLFATDADGDSVTYSLSGTDAGLFHTYVFGKTVNGQIQSHVQLTTRGWSLHNANKSSFTVVVTASDRNGGSDSITVTINVTDETENNAPVFTDGTSTTRSIAENTASGQHIGTALSATDADNDTLTYTLSGTDAASFSIDATTGQLKTKAALDYETKNTYTVTVIVSDGSLTDTITLTINVTDIDIDNVTDIDIEETIVTIPGICQVGDVLAPGESCTYPDTDVEFSVNNNGIGQFLFLTAADNLNIKDTNINGVSYTLVAKKLASGSWEIEQVGTSTARQTVNTAPVFTDGTSTTRSIAENTASGQHIGTPVAATDADNDTLTYTLSGTDAAAFGIDSTTGQLKTKAALDYETKAAYAVTVSVSDDNGGSESITVTINVTDVNETPANTAPVFTDGTSTTRTIAENTAAHVNIGTAIAATDADNDPLTYTLGGTDAASFSIVSTTGQLRTNAALDYETKAAYTVTVSVSDGNGGSDSITVTINVTDINENRTPVFADGASTIRSIAENTAAGQHIGTAVAATDADNDTLTYTLDGTDAASFGIDATTGQLKTKAALDYETKNTYTVTITVSDGSLTDTIDVTINITDVNELPTPTAICKVGDVLTPGESCTYPGTDAVFSVLDDGKSQWNIPNLPTWLQWVNQTSVSNSMNVSTTVNGQAYHFVAEELADNSWEIKEIVDDPNQQPDTPEQPVNTGGTPTPTTSTIVPLTEATLNGGIITLSIDNQTYEASAFRIKNAVSVTGIPGVTVDSVERVSNMVIAVELAFNGNIDTDTTLTFTVDSGAIANYTGPAFTAQTTIPAVTESVAASVEAPLTGATLDESIVTLTLSGRKFERSNFDIRGAVSVAGITGVTVGSFDIDRQSDTEVTVELTFNGNLNADGTLTFTVGPDAIAGYNGPTLTAPIAVSASTEAPMEPEPPIVTEKPIESDYDHIEGPWLWMIAPGGDIDIDNLSEASDGVITEAQIAQTGVNEGDHFNDLQWTSGRLLPTTVCGILLCSSDNVINVIREIGLTDRDQLSYYSAYALINISSPRAQNDVLMGVGSDDSIKVWLNGSAVYKNDVSRRTTGIQNRFSVNLNAGDNLLLIKVCNHGALWANNDWGMFFKLYLDTQDYTLSLPTGGTTGGQQPKTPQQPQQPVNTGGTPTLTASTASPLKEATLDGSVVTLTLSGAKYASSIFDIRDAVSVSGINGVTVRSFDIDRESDTEVTVELTFNGNLNADGTLTLTVGPDAIAGYNGPAFTMQVSVSASTDTPADTGNQNPETPQQPGNTGGTPTLSVSTAPPLTEATLHGSIITLNLSSGAFERSSFTIRDAVSVSGINGLTVDTFDVDRVSDTKITVELEYDGNMTTNGTLTISVGAGAIQDYNGAALTSQIAIPAVSESVTASTTSPLTEATLDESIVTLTLSGRKFERWNSRIRPAVSVSGISGVTVRSFDIDRESDTEVTVELTFNGNLNADSTLTFTVGPDAIAGYNGSALTAQVTVSAGDAPADAGGQNPDPPETPQQPGNQDPPQQPGNTGGTPTLSVSTAAPLTEAMLHGGVITLTLSGGTFERSMFWIRNAISVSGITGVDVESFGGERISDTQATIELEFDGNMTANGILTISLEADGIKDYDGATLTAQIQVTAVRKSVAASTAAPLKEATLDGSVVTLTLSGAKYASSIWDIRDAVSVSGIAGVTIPWNQPKRKSDTEITIELEFDGDMTTDGTLTFTVDADAIAGYNGPALTAQVAVTADRENALLANFPNPFNPETWIPYQLAKPTEVTITIYNINGHGVRTLELGHQPAGIYQTRSRAAYWDGRNAFGEPVASGVYFYTITAGDFTATRKMLIRK